MSGKKGADWFDESDRDKMSMLECCKEGNLKEVSKFLAGGVHIDEEDDDGVTALQIAAAKGHRSLVEFLILKGAKVDRANYAGMTPFLHACREGHQDVVAILANHGANIHATNGLGMSPMALACAGRHLAVVRTLKGLNVSVDQKQNARSVRQIAPSPYMVAFFQMDIQICGFLKQQNANLWHLIKAMDGLDVIRLGTLLELPEMLMKLNYVECTLPEVDKKREIRQVVLKGDDHALAQMIRDREVPAKLHDGLTPLIFAAISGQTIIAELLLKCGKGGAIDAQENVLGMTSLMFAIVAGKCQMVQLLLRHGANPRICSTTREPFSALDLAFFADISRECVEQLCVQWLKVGKNSAQAVAGEQGRKNSGRVEDKLAECREGRRHHEDGGVALMATGGVAKGASTPARLRRVIESIGKNLKGFALEDAGMNWTELIGGMGQMGMGGTGMGGGGGSGGSSLEGGGGTNQTNWMEFGAIAESVAPLLTDSPLQFVLAEHILKGDARPPGTKKSSPDNLIQFARQTAISWMSKRHALQPIPMGNLQGQLSAMASAREDAESDGLYTAAQRNAQKELKKRHRYEPVRKSSRTPVLTPRMLRNSAESKKSPTIDAQQQQRTMRKAPHRLGHYRAASGGSQTQIVSPAVQPDSPRARANTSSSSRANFYLQPPRFPQQLTKEFVREKLLEWQLEKAFQKYFDSEEVDELTFATLREEEAILLGGWVRQVMARRDDKNNIDGLCFRFVGLIQEIKRCTASSELL